MRKVNRGTCRRLQRLWQGPNNLRPGIGCEYISDEESLLMNCHIIESPFGDSCSFRDGVRETAEPIIIDSTKATGNSPRGRQNCRAVLHIVLIANVKCVSQEMEKMTTRESY